MSAQSKSITMAMMIIIMFLAALMISVVSAQAPAPAPLSSTGFSSSSGPAPASSLGPAPAGGPTASDDCMTKLLNMSDCLTYVEEGSKLSTPDKNCCPELAGLVDSSPQCLCQLLGNSGSLGFNIDLPKALKLPSVCKVTTPPVSLCAAIGYPVPGPTSSEAPGGMPPEGLAPSSGNNKSGASSVEGTARAFLIGLGLAFLSTFF